MLKYILIFLCAFAISKAIYYNNYKYLNYIPHKEYNIHQDLHQDLQQNEEIVDYHAPATYKYSYGVEDFKTGDYKTHREERDGDVVKGEYTVADPDGTIRTVTYTVDKHSGFQAVVKKTQVKEEERVVDQGAQYFRHRELEKVVPRYHFNGFRFVGVDNHGLNRYKTISDYEY